MCFLKQDRVIWRIKSLIPTTEYKIEFNKLLSLEFAPIFVDGKYIRDEVKIDHIESMIINEQINLINQYANILGYSKYNIESFLGKYKLGQYVRVHQDMPRHKFVCISYFGDFLGGEYYYIKSNEENIIALDSGVILCCVNESLTSSFRPLHGTKPVAEGVRYALMSSLIYGNDD